MPPPLTTSRLANATAREIALAFADFHDSFRQITRRAAERFRRRDWSQMRSDAKARLQVRATTVDELLRRINELLEERFAERIIWVGAKAVYSGLIDHRQDWEQEMAAETWFHVGPHDVFPEEFVYFLGMPPELKDPFLHHHGDLLTVDFWQSLQQRLAAGEVFHVPPYGPDKCLRREPTNAMASPAAI